MPFKAAHVSFVSFALEVSASGTTQIMIVETDLHLNPKHHSYNQPAVEALIAAARDYIGVSMQGRGYVRLASTRGGDS